MLQRVLQGKIQNGKTACRIKSESTEVSLYNENHWDKIIKFMMNEMINFEKIFKEELKEIKVLVNNEKL